MKYFHEIVEPNPHLPIFYAFHNDNNASAVLDHWHKSLEINYTIAGGISNFSIGEKAFHTNSGDILVVNSNEIHSVQNDNDDTEAMTLIFPYEFIKGEIHDYDKKNFTVTNETDYSDLQREKLTELRLLFEAFYKIMESNSLISNKIYLKSLVFHMLYILDAFFAVEKADDQRHHFTSPVISAITGYIEGNIEKEISLNAITDEFHISYTHLCRLFKKETGRTVHNYIMEQRLNKAVKMLMFTDKNINYIVDACGFPNQKSFSSAFKNKYGMPPKRYREEKIKNGINRP